MPFPIPSQARIRDAILRDQRNLDPKVSVTTDSDTYIRASGDASAIHGLYQCMSWGINQFFPDTADIENLARHASARGIAQIPATSAVGSIAFTGTVGAPVEAGTIAQVNGAQFQTTEAGAIGGNGATTIAAKALVIGPAGNLADNTPGVLLSAPPNVDAAVMITEMGGGVDAESAASLLARLLERLRQPPAGGNQLDYARWAKEVPGVTAAWPYPKRRGGGTVDVGVMSNGLPATEQLRLAVAAHIEQLMPVHVDLMILSPTQVVVDVTGTLTLAAGVVLADVLVKIEAGLAEYFASLKPGDTAYRARINAIVFSVPGVVDIDLISPAGNLETQVNAEQIEIPALGAVMLEV
jgi:uncharacterized phage protein gp47/JayE